MKAELVKRYELRDNSPFYLVDPIEHPNAQVHYTCEEEIVGDTDVWVLYESWAHFNPWLKPEYVTRRVRNHLGLSALMMGPDLWLRG